MNTHKKTHTQQQTHVIKLQLPNYEQIRPNYKTHKLILIFDLPYMTVSQTSQKVLMTTRFCQGRTIYFIGKVNGKILIIIFSYTSSFFLRLVMPSRLEMRTEHRILYYVETT